jgi:hypothetical protein
MFHASATTKPRQHEFDRRHLRPQPGTRRNAARTYARWQNVPSSGATNPVTPSRTIKRGPPASITTAGTPDASASCTTLPKVSVRDGNRKIEVYDGYSKLLQPVR